MKQFSGYAPQKMQIKETLPVGAYVSVIKDAEEVEIGSYHALVLLVDIAEGEQKDFFLRDYKAQDGEDKKWRGRLFVNVPTDDGSEKDALTKRIFNDVIACIEDSNPGYHWNWDEKSLKGRRIGHLSREKEWEFNGKTGWRTELCFVKSVDDIHNGRYKMPQRKPLDKSVASDISYGSFGEPDPQGDEDLPF